ncbi:DUF6461 domain-containing protein [Nonomuraea sp. NBC_01738]|uniref:DUF6461 domain-containing protein n=1 Tax=Nonomuraea sp. NBC_01738 TaxID=2976003 RepID=UPI002E0F893E|nr:DUF6461 domain-containing protein [Nonomuraea sp. NBC_01738]
MNTSHDEFNWLTEFGPFYDVSCVSFVRSVAPTQALTRLGANHTDIEPATFEELQERTMLCFDANGSSYVGALQAPGWTVLIQLWVGSLAHSPSLLRSLSHETEVVCVHRNLHASDYFVYAANSEQTVWFDQLTPGTRSGSDPDRLVREMRQVGLDPEHNWDAPDIDDPFPRAFALAKKITGVSFSRALLELPLSGIEIREG